MQLFIDDKLISDAKIETPAVRFARDADDNLTPIPTKPKGAVLVRTSSPAPAAERVQVRVVETNAEWRFSAVPDSAAVGFYLYPTGAIQQR